MPSYLKPSINTIFFICLFVALCFSFVQAQEVIRIEGKKTNLWLGADVLGTSAAFIGQQNTSTNFRALIQTTPNFALALGGGYDDFRMANLMGNISNKMDGYFFSLGIKLFSTRRFNRTMILDTFARGNNLYVREQHRTSLISKSPEQLGRGMFSFGFGLVLSQYRETYSGYFPGYIFPNTYQQFNTLNKNALGLQLNFEYMFKVWRKIWSGVYLQVYIPIDKYNGGDTNGINIQNIDSGYFPGKGNFRNSYLSLGWNIYYRVSK
jgi:hypothetical protein